MWDPWAVPALVQAAPSVKLLVMLRDPVARFRSGIRHAAKHQGEPSADDVSAAFTRGLYAAQLEPVLRLVGEGRLLVLQFEQCVREPAKFLDRTFDFLGLDPHRPSAPGQRNEGATPDVPISAQLAESARQRYADDARRLVELFPAAIDLELWPRLTDRT